MTPFDKRDDKLNVLLMTVWDQSTNKSTGQYHNIKEGVANDDQQQSQVNPMKTSEQTYKHITNPVEDIFVIKIFEHRD